MSNKELSPLSRYLTEEAVRHIADQRGEEWLTSVLRPCKVKSIGQMPGTALVAIVNVWGNVLDPPKGVTIK